MSILSRFKFLLDILTAIGKILISQVLAIVVVPVALLIFIVNHLFIRACLTMYLRIRFGGKMKLVENSGDAMFGFRSEGNNRNILIALECTGNPRIRQRQEQAAKLLTVKVGNKNPYEKLRWIFTKHLGYFCWKQDTKFDLKNHMIDFKTDGPVTYDRLLELVKELSTDMNEDHPPWQFIFIPNYVNKEGNAGMSAILIRFHHGILDGLSFVNFVSHFMGGVLPDNYDDADEILPEACPETFPYILNPLKSFIPLKYRIMYNINCVLFGFYHLLRTVLSHKTHWNLRGKYPGRSKSYVASEKILLETLKIVREGCNVSVPSILACAFAQALEKTVGSRLPDQELQVGHSLAILPYPDGYFHNRFTLMTVPFKRSSSKSRIERVKEYHRQSVRAMQGPEYSLYYWFFQFYGKLPAAFSKFPLKKPRFSFLLNNLPFASKQVTVWNQRVLDVIGWPPYTTDGGIGLSCVGYCDFIRVGGTSDSSWLTKEELENALGEMVHEINSLAQECSFRV